MRGLRYFAIALSIVAVALLVAAVRRAHERPVADADAGHEPPPSEYFLAQRMGRDGTFPQAQYDRAVQNWLADRGSALSTSAGGLQWQAVGPSNIGGRVTALASVPGGATVYLGAADGGVWKSVDSGSHFSSLTDTQDWLSIGSLALDPTDSNVLYVGTGEANSSVDSYDGKGLFRSRDGGASWEPLGLATTGRIAAIAVDPGNNQHLLVAAMGRQFSTGPDRGLYRSLDGGTTWNKVLYVSDSTGVCDIAINPAHPDTMFCATWERVRRLTYRRAYGPECGVWRSVDRGATWSRLAGGLPVPSDNVGRIALAVSPARPSRIYAQVTSGTSLGYIGLGVWRSDDAGATWLQVDTGTTFRNAFGGTSSSNPGFGWYFGEFGVNPNNGDDCWALGVDLLHSLDGGVTWSTVTNGVHTDQHALWIDPANPNHMYLGNDGGFWVSTNGSTWVPPAQLPISQFYAGNVDATNANHVIGGLQDNSTVWTNSGPASWNTVIGGDGFTALIDPVTPQIEFGEYQFCSSGTGFKRSTNGGATFPNTSGWNSNDRYNWNTPLVMNPRNHNLLISGSQRVYRSTNNGVTWTAISGDLTTNTPAQLTFCTITSVEISKADTSVYYIGTDDGKVWRSLNRGGVWTDISAGLPGRYVTRVTADPLDPLVVYATESGYTSDEQADLVYRSADHGTTWANISAGLPNVPANDLVVDPTNTNFLYLATDVGVYASKTRGAGWFLLGAGMPLQVIADLYYHEGTRQLFAFSHGRSAWKLDLTALPLAVPPAAPAGRLALSAPYPNPARGAVRFTLDLASPATAQVTVHDVLGRQVATLVSGALGAGRHDVAWDRRTLAGTHAAAGIYFVRASAGGLQSTRRLVLEN